MIAFASVDPTRARSRERSSPFDRCRWNSWIQLHPDPAIHANDRSYPFYESSPKRDACDFHTGTAASHRHAWRRRCAVEVRQSMDIETLQLFPDMPSSWHPSFPCRMKPFPSACINRSLIDLSGWSPNIFRRAHPVRNTLLKQKSSLVLTSLSRPTGG